MRQKKLDLWIQYIIQRLWSNYCTPTAAISTCYKPCSLTMGQLTVISDCISTFTHTV